jgi:hypothetical protein
MIPNIAASRPTSLSARIVCLVAAVYDPSGDGEEDGVGMDLGMG